MSSPCLTIDLMPVLSRGKHRSPRKGACFMEFASYLAGEKWSDHPACTHPALAATARLVNDWTTDAGRSRLAPLIPSVIGVNGDDPTIELVIAIRAATRALPVASEGRQRLLAIGLIRLVDRLAEVAPARCEENARMARAALDVVPLAERWARQHIASVPPPRLRTDGPICDAVVAIAVAGIGEACVTDADARLFALLDEAITVCTAMHPASELQPASAVQSTSELPAAEASARPLVPSAS